MSTAYQCDRCGKLYLSGNPPRLNDIAIEKIAYGQRDSYTGRSTASDLCEGCAKEFVAWFKLGGVSHED